LRCCFRLLPRPPRSSTLFPYTTLFRSERGTPPAGSPFFRFHVIDMQGDLQVEAGVPVAAPMEGEGDIVPGVIPAGRYAVATHVRSEEHTSELQSRENLVCRLLLEKKNK